MNALTPADAGASLVTAATDITGLTSDRGIGVDRQIVGKPAMSEASKRIPLTRVAPLPTAS